MNDPSQQSRDRSLFSLAQIQHLIRVEFHRAQRYGYPLSCLMVGVDRLNQLRDLYGYDSKEAVLEEVIEILKREYEEIQSKYKDYKEATAKQTRDLEIKLFTETHTKDILAVEKQVWYDKVSTLKNTN